MPDPKKNVAFNFDVTLISQASRPSIKTSPTLAAGDVKVTGADGTADLAALANITTLPAETPLASGLVKVLLSAAEMNFDRVFIKFSDAAGAEWDDLGIWILTTAVTVDDLVRSTTPANTLEISVSGTAGIDWANISSATTPQALTQTTIQSQGIRKNVALLNFAFLMLDSGDHVSGKTGLTITAQRSLDGAAFAATANAATEVTNGWYKINLNATDLNADVVALRFTATGADTRNIAIVTEP